MAAILRNAYRSARDKGLEHFRAAAAVAAWYNVKVGDVINAVKGRV